MKEKTVDDVANDFIEEFVTGPKPNPAPWLFADELYKVILPVEQVGIHGPEHSQNTMLIARAITYQLSQKQKDLELNPYIISVAARLHDIGRMSDGEDPEHGERGMEILQTFLKKHEKYTLDNYEGDLQKILMALDAQNIVRVLQRAKGKILQIIKTHNHDTHGEDWYEKIVKDADKLDRYRLDLNGPDPERLALDISKSEPMQFCAKMFNGRT